MSANNSGAELELGVPSILLRYRRGAEVEGDVFGSAVGAFKFYFDDSAELYFCRER